MPDAIGLLLEVGAAVPFGPKGFCGPLHEVMALDHGPALVVEAVLDDVGIGSLRREPTPDRQATDDHIDRVNALSESTRGVVRSRSSDRLPARAAGRSDIDEVRLF